MQIVQRGGRKKLKGFEKVFIRAGETVKVKIQVAIDDLRYYSISDKRWILEPGTYILMAGPDSADASLLKARVDFPQ